MSLVKLMRRAIWRTTIRCRFDSVPRRIHHGRLSGIAQSSRLLSHSTGCTLCYSADQSCAHSLQSRILVQAPRQYRVRRLSSSRKPLLFTDDLLQKHVKQITAEWNQLQKQLTGDQSESERLSAEHTSKRLRYLEPIVSKIKQHEQYSADISELEDIISGTRTFIFLDYFCARQN